MRKLTYQLLWQFTFSILAINTIYAQKPKVEVTFEVNQRTPFFSKYRENIGLFKKQAMDIFIKGLNEYIAYAHFTDTSQTQKLKIELISEKSLRDNTVSDHHLLFTFDPGDGRSKTMHEWEEYLLYEEMSVMTNNIDQALSNLSEKWSFYLIGHYNIDLTEKLFSNLYLMLPSQEHYTNTFKAVFPESKIALKLNTDLSRFTVSIEYNDNPNNFTPQDDVKYDKDFKGNTTDGTSKFNGCVCVQLTPWNPIRRPTRGKVYFTKYIRQVYVNISY